MAEAKRGTGKSGTSSQSAPELLAASAGRSFDPDVDLDWSRPPEPDKFHLPPEAVSLYGTRLWRRMSEDQRRQLALHEQACISSLGLLAEVGLMHLLLRVAAEGELSGSRVQYALTNVADESRYVTMLGRSVDTSGAPLYLLPTWVRGLLPIIAAVIAPSPLTWASIVMIEALTDAEHHDVMDDPRVQPAVRMVSRVHTVEQERHLRFAREELTRAVAAATPAQLAAARVALGAIALATLRLRVLPSVYRSVGLNPLVAWTSAQHNARYHAALRRQASDLVATLQTEGLMGRGLAGLVPQLLWRRSHLLQESA